MATLIFIAFSAIRDLYNLSPGLDKSYSLKEAVKEIKLNRNKILFERYCEELWYDQGCSDTKIVPKIMETGRDAFEFLQHERGAYNGNESPELLNYEEIEVVSHEKIDSSCKNKSTFFDNDDPELIYENHFLGVIQEGVSFIISGITLPNCERFSINLILETPTRDIALHFNPRLPQNYIVRNCKIKNVWSTEEVTSPMPFVLERGKEFSIQILITEGEYLLSVNGNHFAEFQHRLPYLNIKCLEVKGDVKDIVFERTIEKEYPKRTSESQPDIVKCISGIENAVEAQSGQYNSETSLTTRITECNKNIYRLPYYAKLPDKFVAGQRINIEGRIKVLPHSFFVNLQSGHNIWPHSIIAFHFNPRFAVDGKNLKHIICKNSWINGKWNQEERHEITNEFVPGRSFTLGLCAANSCYEVYLNEKFIANYYHRIDEGIVDTIYIQGDVQIWGVNLVTDACSTDGAINEVFTYSNKSKETDTQWV